MKYKSKYKTALLLQKKEIINKESELSLLTNEIKIIQSELKKETQKREEFRTALQKGGELNSSYFFAIIDIEKTNKRQRELEEKEAELREKRKEYHFLKKRMDHMEELDKKSEKEFYRAIERKEIKKLQNLSQYDKEKGGD